MSSRSVRKSWFSYSDKKNLDIQSKGEYDANTPKMTILYVYLKCKVSNDCNLFFQAGHHVTHPSNCDDTILLSIGSRGKIKITAANQERYRYATFIASNHRVVITFISCFRYLTASGYMYQFKIETTGM